MKSSELVQDKIYYNDIAAFLKFKEGEDKYGIVGSHCCCRIVEGESDPVTEIESPVLFKIIKNYHNAVLDHSWLKAVQAKDIELASSIIEAHIEEDPEKEE